MTTEDIRLSLVIRRPAGDGDAGTLALQMATLKPRPGDNWPTGEDASQGPCDEATLERVIADIRAYLATGRRHGAPAPMTPTEKDNDNGDDHQHDDGRKPGHTGVPAAEQ